VKDAESAGQVREWPSIDLGKDRGFAVQFGDSLLPFQQGEIMRSIIITTLVLLAAVARIAKAEETIGALPETQVNSTAPQMIAVELRLVEISRSKMREMGFDFAFIDGDKARTVDMAGVFQETTSKAAADLVKALTKNNIGRVLASPQIVALDGKEASLSIGSQSEVGAADELAASDSSIKMRIRPDLLADERLTVEINLEWSGNERVGADQEVENQLRHFQLQTTIASRLGSSTLLARSLQLENDSDIVMLIVTPQLMEMTAGTKQPSIK
jgi:hypothetical protein